MSPGLINGQNAPEIAFRGVNGNSISLDETTDSSQYPNSGVLKFVLKNNRTFSLRTNIALLIIVAVVFTATNNPAILVGSLIFIAIQCKYFISSVNIDTLLVVESVGIQIIGKRVFSSEESSIFLPWNTVQDIFINEVITGQKVLYYLTFLVKESVAGKETTKLVPLFHEIKPERKCLEYINTEDFAYPKELTKVIRRIIKSQPRQGQQFGTRHLLVTYNHSAWMRQDKMFAMLKFRDRTDATAFPHAFVLTVKTLNVLTPEESCSINKSNESTNANTENDKNPRLQNIEAESEKSDKADSENHNSNSEMNFDDLSSTNKPSSSITDAREPETERKKDPGKKNTKRPKSLDGIDSLPPVKRQNRRGHSISEQTKHKDQSNSVGIASDSADLPYQYIIEKEIEDSKVLSEDDCLTADEAESNPGPSQNLNGLPGKILPRSPRAAQTDTTRSADITDLVMEGLMFTIRQDQDSITVVEQKTKLEMDEVLENSEKAETKEGEKCLLNSSLLRLENLITKIDMPGMRSKNNNEDTPKSAPAAFDNDRNVDKSFFYSSSSNSRNFDISSWQYEKSSQHSPILEIPKFPLVKINLSNIKDVFNDELSFDSNSKESKTNDIDKNIKDHENNDKVTEEIEEEEEDEVGLELKYDEKDDTEIDKTEKESEDKNEIVEFRNDDTKNRSIDLSTTPIKDCIGIFKTNTPRIVSNEIITDDQIPPELQRALRYKRTKRLFSDDETEKNDSKNSSSIIEEPTNHSENSSESTIKSSENSIDIELFEQEISIEKRRKQPLRKTNDRSEDEIDKNVAKNSLLNTETISSQIELSISKNRPIVESVKSSVTPVDITEVFQQELLNEKRKKKSVRKMSLRNAEETSSNSEKPEIRIEMWKFMQDITRGAKVVVRRLDLSNIPNGVVTESSISKYNANQRYATES